MIGLQIDNLTIILLALILILLLCILAATIFHRILPRMVERKGNLAEIEAKFQEMQEEALEMQARLRELQTQCSRQELERSRLETELRKLQKTNTTAPAHIPDFIHEVGEPRANCQKFTAELSLDSTAAYFRSSGEPFNPMWRHRNLAEVWASDIEEAKQLIEQAFSYKLGYQKVFKSTVSEGKS